MGRTGNGASITISGVSMGVISINPGAFKRGAVNDDLLATEDFSEMIPEDLATVDEIELTVAWDPQEAVPDIHGAAATATITWPLGTGDVAAANLAGTAFVTEVGFPELANNTRQEATVKLQYDGKTGPTYTAATTS